MVRETRFAFDDDFDDSTPHSHEDFTEEDDRFLDAFSHPDHQNPSDDSVKPHPKSTKPHRKSEAQNKHLADADWLSPKPPAQSHRRKSA